MTQQWYFSRDGKTKSGPVSAAQLKELARSGRLVPTDQLWREGLTQWMPATKVKGLFPNDQSNPPEAVAVVTADLYTSDELQPEPAQVGLLGRFKERWKK